MARLILTICVTLLAWHPAAAVPLWEITGTQNRILLLGSVHFLRAEDYPLPAAVDDAIRQSDAIVMELDMDRLDPLAVQRDFMTRAVDPDGLDLQARLGDAQWLQAQRLAADIGIQLELFQPYEPWFAAVQIAQLRLVQLGFDGSQGIEKYITRLARRNATPISGLETIDDQLRAFDTLPADVQTSFLLQTLEEAGSIGDELDSVIVAWKEADTVQLETLLLEGLAGQPDVYEHLLVQRNQRWIRKILDMTDDRQNYLIVVGTMHLIGPDSLQNMLAEAGIETKKIP